MGTTARQILRLDHSSPPNDAVVHACWKEAKLRWVGTDIPAIRDPGSFRDARTMLTKGSRVTTVMAARRR